VADLFAPVAGDLTMVKEIAGYGIYWPDMGINTLNSFVPGDAYFVLVSDNSSITFGDCSKATAAPSTMNFEALAAMSPWPLYNPTVISHAVAILPEASHTFATEGLYGAFDTQDNCFGVARRINGTSVLTLFGDDPMTAEKDGFHQGETIVFKAYDNSTGETYVLIPEFDISLPDFNGTFNENGMSAVTGFKVTNTGINESALSAVSIYPNPSTGKFTVAGIDENSRITIINMHGQTVDSFVNNSASEMTIHLSADETGIFMVKIVNGNNIVYKKLVIK
jgi:hypothetical protein